MFAALASFLLFAAAPGGQTAATAAEHANRALQYAQSGDLVHAENELRRAVELSPNDPSYLTSLGGVLGMQHKLAEANPYFERAVKADPSDATALRNLAANEWQLKRLGQARTHLERLLRIQPGDQTAQLLLGMVAENQHDYALAARLLVAVPELMAQHPESVAALASAEYHTGRRQEARQALKGLLGRSAEPQGIFAAASVAALAQDYQTAEKLLLEATGSGGATSEMYSLLGWCYQKDNQLDAAAGALRSAIRLDPGNEPNYLDLTDVLVRENKAPAALEVARTASKRFPRSSGVWRIRGEIEIKEKLFTDAINSYRRAVDLEPESLDGQAGLAAAEWSAGIRAEGEAAFQRLVLQHPDQASIYERYGTLLMESATDAAALEQAAALLRKAVALDNSRAEAHYQLGLFELNQAAGREALSEARKHLENAARLKPEDGRVHYALARLYRRMGLRSEAASEMQRYQKVEAAGQQ